ncbi:MAG: protein kinase [Gemmatales bacterium]
MNVQQDSAKTIFLAALERPEAERAGYLDEACGGELGLRERVEALLNAHRQDSFLDPRKLHPASGRTQTSDFDDTSNSAEQARPQQAPHPLVTWLQPSKQPNSLGRFLHYEVLEELGQGGFGIVYRVFDEKLHRVVALKVLSPTLASHGTARQRFLREARAAAAVRHEHVISIHAVDDEPLPHLVMEYISGQTLQSKIDKVGTLQLKEILRIGMQMAQGLEAAHKQGLIHRDIKPSNILLENGIERVKISDFGLARAVDDTTISQQGQIMGTPAYMSPEQAEGQAVDARSDLFSLGSTLYAMCTGTPPFEAPTTLATLRQVTEMTPVPIAKKNPELPGWLDDVVSKLMAKSPEARFQTAREVSEVLANKLAEVQGPVPAKPASRRLRIWAILSTILIALIVLAFTERWGLTRLTPPILKLFHHKLTLELPHSDTIVEIWQTTDTKDNSPRSRSMFAHGAFEPFATVVNKRNQSVILPPGNYWVVARYQGKQIERKLIAIGWGGSSTIAIPLPPVQQVSKPATVPATSKQETLHGLHELAQAEFKATEERYQRGIVPFDEVVQKKLKLLEIQVQQAQERQNHLEVKDYLNRIVDEHRTLLRLANERHKAGVITERDLLVVREGLYRAELRLKAVQEEKE